MGGTSHPRRHCAWLAPALALLASPIAAQELKCDVGALDRTIGGGAWRVHACSDGSSLVVVALAENPAAPFYFFLHRQGGKYDLAGEGNGDAVWTKPAFDELAAMDAEAISALDAQVRATVVRSATPP